jgi:hypothetical protein
MPKLPRTEFTLAAAAIASTLGAPGTAHEWSSHEPAGLKA